MSGYLLDTHVLSELVRKRPDAAVASRVGALRPQAAATSAICVMAIGTEDVLIGATARAHGLTVVTRTIRHLDRIPGVRVESWWGT